MSTLNLAATASAILERRRSLSSIVQSGELCAKIGTAGFQEALRRRWVVPDCEMTGALQVSNALSVVQEMEDAAYKVGDSVTVASNGKAVVGVVKAVGKDGKLKVSFGPGQGTADQDYSPEELQKNEKPEKSAPIPPTAS